MRCCCCEEGWRMIGRRISQCTRFRQSRKTDDRPVSTIREPSFHQLRRFLLKGILRRILRKSRSSKHRTSTNHSQTSLNLTSNNVASEMKIDFSPKGTRLTNSLTRRRLFPLLPRWRVGSFDDGQYLPSYSG